MHTMWQVGAIFVFVGVAILLFLVSAIEGEIEYWKTGLTFVLYALLMFGLFELFGCGPDGPALPTPPDFSARPCATVPVCSPDMGRDLSTVEDLRYFLDLAAQP